MDTVKANPPDHGHIAVFDVAPGDDESWYIFVNGNMIGHCSERDNAVEIATELARSHAPSRMLTRTTMGEIESITPFVCDDTCRAAEESRKLHASDAAAQD